MDEQQVVLPKASPLGNERGAELTAVPERELLKDKHLASVGIVMSHGKVISKILLTLIPNGLDSHFDLISAQLLQTISFVISRAH